LIEVGRLLLSRLDDFRAKGGGGESAVGFPVLLDGCNASQKARFVHGAAIDSQAILAEHRGLIDFGRHHLGTDAVGHLNAAQRVAVLYGDDAELDRLAGFIAPIGPVRGDPHLNRAGAVLGNERKDKNGEKDESKRRST
jgi:hypothetical protein